MYLKPVLLFLFYFLSLQSIAQDSGWFKEFSNKLELIQFNPEQHRQVLTSKKEESIVQYIELKDGTIYGYSTTYYKKSNGQYVYIAEKQNIEAFTVDSNQLLHLKTNNLYSFKIVDTVRQSIDFGKHHYQNQSMSHSFKGSHKAKDTLLMSAFGVLPIALKEKNALAHVGLEYNGFNNYYLGAQFSLYYSVRKHPENRLSYAIKSHKYLDLGFQFNRQSDLIFQLTPYFKLKERSFSVRYTLQNLKEQDLLEQKAIISTSITKWKRRFFLFGGIGVNQLENKINPGFSITGIYGFVNDFHLQTRLEYYINDCDYHLKFGKTIYLSKQQLPNFITPYIGYQDLFKSKGILYGCVIWY